MTVKKENFGCLTVSMRKFLKMSEKKRSKEYTKNQISQTFRRVQKNVTASFDDQKLAFSYLPETHKEKIDLVQRFDDLLNYVNTNKLTTHVPDVPLGEIINQLKNTHDEIKNKKLKVYAGPKFDEFISLLEFIESRNPPQRKKIVTKNHPGLIYTMQ